MKKEEMRKRIEAEYRKVQRQIDRFGNRELNAAEYSVVSKLLDRSVYLSMELDRLGARF